MTSYQKLKARIKELEEDKKFYQSAIKSLVLNPHGIASETIKFHVRQQSNIDKQLLFGCGESKSIGIFNVESK